MGSSVDTPNMEGRTTGFSLVLILILVNCVSSNPRYTRETEEDVTTTIKSIVEKLIENESSDNEVEVSENKMNMKQESSKPQQDHEKDIEKHCRKCHKASYKYRKVDFCAKCVEKGLVNEASDVTDGLHCKKCKKSKFRAKNEDFCITKCPKEEVKKAEKDEETTEEEAGEDITTVKPEDYKLGPLGNLLKFFVVTNTWGTAETPTKE